MFESAHSECPIKHFHLVVRDQFMCPETQIIIKGSSDLHRDFLDAAKNRSSKIVFVVEFQNKWVISTSVIRWIGGIIPCVHSVNWGEVIPYIFCGHMQYYSINVLTKQ